MYYHNIWDPLLICSQMLVLQCAFYAQFGLFLVLFHYLLDTRLSLSLLLDGGCIDLGSADGWTPVMAQLCTAAVCSYAVLLVVGRAKRCLDFCSTLYLFHYLTCAAYGGVPASWQFYFVLAASVAVTVLLSEWLCMHEELKWIPTTGGGSGGGGGGGMSGMGGGPSASADLAGSVSGAVSVGGLGATVSSALSRLSGHSPRLPATSAGGLSGAGGGGGSSANGGGGGVGIGGAGGAAGSGGAADLDGELTADHLDGDDDVDESRSLLKLKVVKP